MQDSIQNDDAVVDSLGAAQFIGMGAYYVAKHSSGKAKPQIPYFKIGGRLRFKVSDLKAFVAAQGKKS
jgi:hypothetical protein